MLKIHNMRKLFKSRPSSQPLVSADGRSFCLSWREVLLLLATLLIGTTDAFVNFPLAPSCCSTTIHQHHSDNKKNDNLLFQPMMMTKDDHRENSGGGHNSLDDNNNIIKTHVVASDAMILPGEGMTLFMSNQEAFPLIQNCLNGGSDDECHRQVVVAVKLMTGAMGEIASLCEIQEISFGTQNEYVQVDLKCTGQVRLLGEAQEQYSQDHYLFHVECGVDATFADEADLTVAIDLQEEIDSLMKHISEMEDQIQQELCEHHRQADAPHSLRPRTCFMPPVPLIDQYEAAKANVQQACAWNYKPPQPPPQSPPSASSSSTTLPNHAHLDTTTEAEEDEEDRMLRLTATSWGVFLCLNDPKLEARYRTKLPLQLLDRIKLAQYALREKQLHLQGRLLQLQQEEEDQDDVYDDNDDDRDSVVVDTTTANRYDSNSVNNNLDDYRDNDNDNRLRDNYFDDLDAFQ